MLNKKLIVALAVSILLFLGIYTFAFNPDDETPDTEPEVNETENTKEEDQQVVEDEEVNDEIDGDEITTVQTTVRRAMADTTPPVITLLGEAEVTIEVFTAYVDAGATALDNVDGDLTESIVSVSTVNSNIVGTYTVTYNVNDAAGNPATAVVRTVYVVDTEIPLISLKGDNPYYHEVNTPYDDLGAIAVDNYDGTISENIVVTGTVDVTALGEYILTYNVKDSEGNDADTVTRTVIVVDTTAPVINIDESDLIVTLDLYEEYNEPIVTVTDNSSEEIEPMKDGTVDTSIAGRYVVTYTAEDSSENKATPVEVVVLVRPLITAPEDYLHEEGVLHNSKKAIVDLGDTTLEKEPDENTVNIDELGEYTLTYNYTLPIQEYDGIAATSATTTVTVVQAKPQGLIFFNKDDELMTDIKNAWESEGYTPGVIEADHTATYTDWVNARSYDEYDDETYIVGLGLCPNKETVESCYRITYTPDKSDPTVSPIGVTEVDLGTPGSYFITYTVFDQTGHSTSRGRWVDVVDTIKPVVTVHGAREIYLEAGIDEYYEHGSEAFDVGDDQLSFYINVDYYNEDLLKWERIHSKTIDNNRLGTYRIRYFYTDSSNNVGVGVRFIYVQDTTPPVITVLGDNPVKIELGYNYVDAGAEASDIYDGDVTSNIQVESTIIPGVIGEYTVTYYVEDNAGNYATATRDVKVVTAKPVIDNMDNLEDHLQVFEAVDGTYDPTTTLHVEDEYDGSSIRIANKYCEPLGSHDDCYIIRYRQWDAGVNDRDEYTLVDTVDLSKVGKYRIDYRVTDNTGHDNYRYIFIYVKDETPPTLSVTPNYDLIYEVGSAAPDWDDVEFTATDNSNDPLSNLIIDKSNVNMDIVGYFDVIYKVKETLYERNYNGAVRNLLFSNEVPVRVHIVKPMEITTNASEFKTNIPKEFTVGTIANCDENTMVKAHFNLPPQAIIEYQEEGRDDWIQLIDVYGPTGGFPLMDKTSTFRGTFTEAGEYTIVVEFRKVSDGTVIGSKDITINVEASEPPTISFEGLPNTSMMNEVDLFKMQLDEGDYGEHNVMGKIELTEGNASGFKLEFYLDEEGHQWDQHWIEAKFEDGVYWYGPKDLFTGEHYGSLLKNVAETDFSVSWIEAGTYKLEVSIMSGNTEDGFNHELASEIITIEVETPEPPTISFEGLPNTSMMNEVDSFKMQVSEGSYGEHNVMGKIEITEGNASGFKLEFYLDEEGHPWDKEWIEAKFVDGVYWYGPKDLETGEHYGSLLKNVAETDFRVTWIEAGTYQLEVSIMSETTEDGFNHELASEIIEIEVEIETPESPTISFEGLPNTSTVSKVDSFKMQVSEGSYGEHNVMGKIELTEGNASGFKLEFYLDEEGHPWDKNWIEAKFVDGVYWYGPKDLVTGEHYGSLLANVAETDFRVSWIETGTYKLEVSIMSGNTEDGFNYELASEIIEIEVEESLFSPSVNYEDVEGDQVQLNITEGFAGFEFWYRWHTTNQLEGSNWFNNMTLFNHNDIINTNSDMPYLWIQARNTSTHEKFRFLADKEE